MKIHSLHLTSRFVRRLAGLSVIMAGFAANGLELANLPLTTSSATSMRPNILFVLDDSGSMGWNWMPDYVYLDGMCKTSTGWGAVCGDADPPSFSSGFNGIYYNPDFTYKPPVNADGTSRPDQFRLSGSTKKWDQVQSNHYLNSSTVQNLEIGYQDKIWCTTKTPLSTDKNNASLPTATICRRNGLAYTATPAVSANYNYPNPSFQYPQVPLGAPYYYKLASIQWCTAWTGGTCLARRNSVLGMINPRYGAFTRTDITATSCSPTCPSGRTYENEMTNFANWFAYYRTRIDMMKTGVGRAFAGLDDNYRSGFMTIHTTASSSTNFIPIQTFDSAQKTVWYNKLYAISPNSATPLRAALSTAGQIFAGKALTDPVQYSCQKNFTLLSTDGMWNGSAGFKLDNSPIGNQDNSTADMPRPKYDGNFLASTLASETQKGGADTLADVAAYYYKTDLRTPALGNCVGALGGATDVCKNNVPPSNKDPASHQHMTTFTIGLGVDGTLAYTPDYETAPTGDFSQIRTGAKNWPSPKGNDDTSIDDLWHAAVNGGGTYYSAKNPQALSDGLGDALREVGSRTGAAAAASTSNPQITTTDNFVFSANYRTAFWDSVVRRRRINIATGVIEKGIDWEAGAILNTMTTASADVRNIYMFKAGNPNNLEDFRANKLSASQQAYLEVNSWADPATKLPHWAGLNLAGQTAGKAPGALVGFLRGQTGLEDDIGDPNIPFRGRENVLGDIVNAETVYVGKSEFKYSDAGHAAFVNWTANPVNRPRTLFAAANDGMLHAINGDTGSEMWAYVPSMVMPNLYKLADKNYVHEFFVDGTPEVGDIFVGGSWRTILVGGLNKGGKGYYALDITNPAAPKALWEFCNDSSLCPTTNDANIGYSYGNPIITKLGTEWVVMVTSGYNNADGKGYLYILDPITGAKKYTIATACTGANCGISKINAWIDNYQDNTAMRVYGGDLEGSLWRFDVNNSIAPAGRDAFKLAQLGNPPGTIQSITTRPELSSVDNIPVVFVGTGRFLGNPDKTDNTVNSFYAIKDDLATAHGTIRSGTSFVKQILTASTSKLGQNIITNSNTNVDWTTKSGWYLDFINTGERSFTDPVVGLGTLTFTTNIPAVGDPCSGGGISWQYELNWRTGGAVISSERNAAGELTAAKFLANEFATRPVLVQLPNGKVITIIQLNIGDSVNAAGTEIVGGVAGSGTRSGPHTVPDKVRARRAGWREIF